MKLSEVYHFFNTSLSQEQDELIQGVSIDSRHVRPGELFVAILGENFDGHDFVEQAFQQGACAAIVSKPPTSGLSVSISQINSEGSPPLQRGAQGGFAIDLHRSPLILVNDTQQALRDLAAWHRSSLSVPVLALTGSCGKTTTKEMLASILRERYQVFATPGNKNNHLGVPLSILQCTTEDEVAVFELGANHVGEIRSNVQLVRPDAALITNVGSAHIGEFGGVEAIFSAKSEIFEGLSTEGTAVYSYDDAFAEQWKKLLEGRKTLTFGLNPKADVFADKIHFDASMCATFQLNTPTGSSVVKLNLPGEHNVLNALAASALSFVLGFSSETMAKGLGKCQGVARRMTFRRGLKGARIIDDTYNANLKSIEAAMQVLAGFSGKRFLVLGDIGELGQWGEEHHRLIGTKASQLGLDGVFTCGQLSRYASDSFRALNHASGHELSFHFSDIPSLLEVLKNHLDAQTTVVVKGSLSSHMENVVSEIIDVTVNLGSN